MAGGVVWFLSAYGLLALTAFFDSLPKPSEHLLAARLGADAGSLLGVEHLLHPAGALAVGLLFDRRGARWCLLVCQISAVVQHLLRLLSVSFVVMYVSKLPTFFCHTPLVLRALLLQAAPSERRAHVLAHAGLAHYVGANAGQLLGGSLGTGGGTGAGALGALLGLLLALPLTSRGSLPNDVALERVSHAEPVLLGKRASSDLYFKEKSGGTSPLPEPAVMPSSWPVAQEGLVQLLSRPMVLQLVLLRLCALTGQHIKNVTFGASVQREFSVLIPYEDVMSIGGRMSDIAGMAFLVGPCIYRCTPRTFICICLAWKAAIGLSVAIDFSELNPVRRLIPVDAWLGLIFLERMWSIALQTVLTWLLVSAVARGQRGAALGVDGFLALLPYMGSLSLAWWLYGHGGAVGIFTASAALNIFSLLVARLAVLPRYREKAG